MLIGKRIKNIYICSNKKMRQPVKDVAFCINVFQWHLGIF